MKTYEISEEVIKGLIAYLKTKPYSEVAAGITTLSQLEEIKKGEQSSNGNKDSKILNLKDENKK